MEELLHSFMDLCMMKQLHMHGNRIQFLEEVIECVVRINAMPSQPMMNLTAHPYSQIVIAVDQLTSCNGCCWHKRLEVLKAMPTAMAMFHWPISCMLLG